MAKKAAVGEAKAKYKVIGNLRCDGEHKPRGSFVELTAQEAAPLLRHGAVKPVAAERAAKPEGEPKA